MRLGRAVASVVSTIIPWPSRHHRRVLIEEAQQGLADQQALLEAAQLTQHEIDAITAVAGNHFAQRIANQIARGYGPGHPQGRT